MCAYSFEITIMQLPAKPEADTRLELIAALEQVQPMSKNA